MNSSLGKACLWLALVPLAAMADEPSADTDFFGEFPVVLSASRLEQPVNEAPATVTVIDREMIKASGVRELADLFRLVPGMEVGRRNGHAPILGFNGFGDPYFRQFQVLVDGVSIYSPLYGGVDWGELPFSLEDVERMEVVRGPNAATYGANSFLGVVNIITRDPATEPGFEASVNAGDNRIADEVVRVARNDGDLRYRISAGQRADRGLAALPDSRRSNFLNLRSHYRLNARDELRVQFGYSGGYGEEGLYATGPSTNGPRPAVFESKSIQMRWTRANGPDDEFWVQLDHAERTNHDMLPYSLNLGPLLGSYDYPLSFNYDTRRSDIELQRTTKLDEGLRAVYGAQAREDGARSKTYFNTPDWLTSNLARLFGNLEWRPAPAWLVDAGAMWETNSITGGAISPTLAIIRHLTPEHTLRARVASARRTPTLFEDQSNWRYAVPAQLLPLLPARYRSLPLFQSSLTPMQLNDEKVVSREISYMGEFPTLRLNVDVTIFYDRTRDLISQYQYPYASILGILNPASDATTVGYANSSWADSHGTNVSVKWRPWQGGRLIFAGSRSIIESNNINLAATAPKHTASALFEQDLPVETSFSLAYYRVGSMRWVGSGQMLPAFDRVDVRLAKRFQWGAHKAELSWVTQNVFNPIPVFKSTMLDKRTSWIQLQYEY